MFRGRTLRHFRPRYERGESGGSPGGTRSVAWNSGVFARFCGQPAQDGFQRMTSSRRFFRRNSACSRLHACRVSASFVPVSTTIATCEVSGSAASASQNDRPLPVGIRTSAQMMSGTRFAIFNVAVSRLRVCSTSRPILSQRLVKAQRKSSSSSISRMVFLVMLRSPERMTSIAERTSSAS